MSRRYGLVVAVAAWLAVGCRSPAPGASATTPTVTVSVPAPSAEAPPIPEPEQPPWGRLLAVQAVFSGGTPEPPCPADRAARLLVTGEDGKGRLDLAQQAGCAALPTESKVEIPLCCPTRLEAPSPLRSGGGKSCEQAQQEYVASFGLEADEDAPPDVSAGAYGAILNRGQYLNACGVKGTSGVSICVAVQFGGVKGVTVRTTPASIEMADCIATEVRKLGFPTHPRMDISRTTFAASE